MSRHEAAGKTGFEPGGVFSFPNYSRPSEKSDLFAPSGTRRNEALIGSPDNDWDLYCMGYWRAADALVDHLTQHRDPEVDRPYAAYWESQAYAILFLYRHYLELRLKEIYTGYGGSIDDLSKEHRLLKIWEAVRREDRKSSGEDLPDDILEDLRVAEAIITQFNRLDGNSQAFRYPKSRSGTVTVAAMQIDLIRLKEALGWLSQFLDGWSEGVYQVRHASYE